MTNYPSIMMLHSTAQVAAPAMRLAMPGAGFGVIRNLCIRSGP